VARVALAAAERQVVSQAAQALYGATGWRTVARRLAAQDSLLLSAEASVRSRFSVGDARYVDVLRLRTERLRVQSDRAAAETESDAAAVALVALAGGDSAALRAASDAVAALDSAGRGAPPAARAVSLAIQLPEAPSLDSLLALAADVRLADARLAQTAAQRRLLLARQRPAFSASVGLQRLSADRDQGQSFGPVLAAGMSLPFTAGRANRAALAAVDQQAVAVGVARTATIATVRAALTVGRARYEAARRRATAFDATLLRAAREERESALAAYRTNDLSLLELLDFERALARAEIDRTRATLDALSSLTELLSGAPSLGTPALGIPSSEADMGRSSDDR
jgi:outer membrane protein TolC